jgi:hypothetical protein
MLRRQYYILRFMVPMKVWSFISESKIFFQHGGQFQDCVTRDLPSNTYKFQANFSTFVKLLNRVTSIAFYIKIFRKNKLSCLKAFFVNDFFV